MGNEDVVSSPTPNSQLPAPSAAFDAVAPVYDATFGPQANLVMAYLRRRSLAVLLASFPPGSELLELGCGTGQEALTLARAGRRVLATDPSPAMLERAAANVAAGDMDRAVAFRTLAAGEIGRLPAERGAGAFDGAYASFGPLNCVSDLCAVAADLHRLLRPGAGLVCSVMNRFCLWEVAWYLLHADLRCATRRWAPGPRAASVLPGRPPSLAVRYYTPGAFVARTRPYFVAERVEALPLLLPPPGLEALYRRHRRFFRRLERLESRLAGLPLLRDFGDHFLVVLRRGGGRRNGAD